MVIIFKAPCLIIGSALFPWFSDEAHQDALIQFGSFTNDCSAAYILLPREVLSDSNDGVLQCRVNSKSLFCTRLYYN